MGQAQSICFSSGKEDELLLSELLLDGCGEAVYVNIYDVDPRVQLVNELCRAVGGGAYHAGVAVYGIEWSFGATPDRRTGVFSCLPALSPAVGRCLQTVRVGGTKLTEAEVLDRILVLQEQWIGDDYDCVSRNCCHFCDCLLTLLGAGRMPSWVHRLADTGLALREGALAVQKAANSAAPALITGVQCGLEAMQRFVQSISVVLDCVHAVGVDLERLPAAERRISIKVAPGHPELIGPLQQPQAFDRLLPHGSGLKEEQYLFELAWEPPCLYLRKPRPEAMLTVSGAPVRSQTYVLLNSSEIGVCCRDESLEETQLQLVFKVDRGGGPTKSQATTLFSNYSRTPQPEVAPPAPSPRAGL